MITAKQAVDIINRQYPELTVTLGCDYDDKYFVFTAVEDPDSLDANDPFYAVDKRSGSIKHFSPMSNLPAYLKAMAERMVEV